MIRKTVAVALIVSRITVFSFSRFRERRAAATTKVRKAPTEEASTGVKNPVYIPPMVTRTTPTIGVACPRDDRRSASPDRGPEGPAWGLRTTTR